jgi:Tfp pilus assembly protein PilO
MTDLRRIVGENRRTIWVLVAALLANVALYALVVRPLGARVAAEEQLAGSAIRDLNAARRSHQLAQQTVSGKQQAEEELQKFYAEVLPPDLSGARRILYPHLDRLARSSNLRTVRYNFHPEPDRRTDLRKLTMTLQLAGEYANIRRFIHELESVHEFLVLESVSVSQAQSSRELSVTALVATYFRTDIDGS